MIIIGLFLLGSLQTTHFAGAIVAHGAKVAPKDFLATETERLRSINGLTDDEDVSDGSGDASGDQTDTGEPYTIALLLRPPV